ncbi:MAG: hypothetical protein M3Q07_25430 [Pseudobdellovibrionaceae bacterium]|nr:hypothetical protein [Pseudobdellovibrionaceae bacterium]
MNEKALSNLGTMRNLKTFITWVWLLGAMFNPASPALMAGTGTKPSSEPHLDLDHREALEFALQDYPERHVPWIKQLLADPALEQGSLRWLRAHWFLSQAEQGKADQPLEKLATRAFKGAEQID